MVMRIVTITRMLSGHMNVYGIILKNHMPNKVVYRESWILFRDSPNWHQRLLKRGFGHVSILMKDEFNWIHVEPVFPTPKIEILDWGADEDVISNLSDIYTIVHCNVPIKIKPYTYGIGLRFITCINLVRYIAGVKATGFTPFHFYCNLLKSSEGKLVNGRTT